MGSVGTSPPARPGREDAEQAAVFGRADVEVVGSGFDVGSVPLASDSVQARPGIALTATSPQSRRILIDAAPHSNEPPIGGKAVAPWYDPQAPAVAPLTPLLSRPPTMSPNVAATMSPPTNPNRVRDNNSPTPEPDQDHRPQGPQIGDLRLGQHVRPDEQRDRTGKDEEHAPPQGASSDVHVATVPCRQGRVLASAPVAATVGGPMRLSGWVEIAPRPEAVSPKVLAVVEPMLTMLGCEPDPPCWVVWGDDPGARYTVLAATAAGLVQVNARVNVPGEGPRAGASSSAGLAPRSATSRSRCRAVTAS